MDTADSAELLRGLHVPGSPLVLANAWDVPSARLVAEAGFPAVATGSEAVAETLGYADGQRAPVDAMFAATKRIADAVSVPVTMDVESGYGLEPKDLVARLLEAGAVGCNLEDRDHDSGELVDVDEHADRLAAVVEAGRDAGVSIVVNARTDVFLLARKRGEVVDDAVLEQALSRCRR